MDKSTLLDLLILYGLEEGSFSLSYSKKDGWWFTLGETKYYYAVEENVNFEHVIPQLIRHHFSNKGIKYD